MKKLSIYLMLLLGVAVFASCEEVAEREPSPEANPNSYRVYFPEQPREIAVEEEGANAIKIYIAREVTTGALTVSLAITADAAFTIPESVIFADGDSVADFTLSINAELETWKVNRVTLEFDKSQNDPYRLLSNPVLGLDIKKLGVPDWEALEGTWTVTEDWYAIGETEDGQPYKEWENEYQYEITITGVPKSRNDIKIEGFAPYGKSDNAIDASVTDMKLTLLSQELKPTWKDEHKTHFAAYASSTEKNNVGKNFPVTNIKTNSNGKLEVELRSGYSLYSYFVYSLKENDDSYDELLTYCRNTVWVKN